MPDPDLSIMNQVDSGLGQYIAGRVHEDFTPLASQCYDNALAQHPGLEGKVTMRFTIVGDRKNRRSGR